MPPHDFKNFPELTNRQMQFYYFQSPHKQIVEDFMAKVVKVTDGDTIRVSVDFRDFDFPIRLLNIAAPEIDEPGGVRSRNWLENRIMGKEIGISINPNNRVEKWGRLLGIVYHGGLSVNNELINMGFAVAWEDRAGHGFPDIKEELNIKKWF